MSTTLRFQSLSENTQALFLVDGSGVPIFTSQPANQLWCSGLRGDDKPMEVINRVNRGNPQKYRRRDDNHWGPFLENDRR